MTETIKVSELDGYPYKANIILAKSNEGKEVLRIDPEGRVFWNGREVETDDEFRAAMLDLAACLMGVK